jgi:hypothetical protein
VHATTSVYRSNPTHEWRALQRPESGPPPAPGRCLDLLPAVSSIKGDAFARAPALPTYIATRRLFLRLLGAVYFVAFASLATQIGGLAGERGILPAGRFLDLVDSMYGAGSYLQLPTIFWLDASDAALRLAAWGGAVLAVLLVFGIARSSCSSCSGRCTSR